MMHGSLPSMHGGAPHARLRTVPRTPGTADPRPESRRGRCRRLRDAHRLLDQRLLQGVQQTPRRRGVDRHDVAGRIRRWRAVEPGPHHHGRGHDLGWCTDRRQLVRRPTDGSGTVHLRHRGPAGGIPPRHAQRRDHLVHRHVRARCRLRSRRPQDVCGSRQRCVRRQRPEDLDLLRSRRRLLLPDLSHIERRATAQGRVGADRADGSPRHRGPPDHRHDHQPALLRGLFRRRPRARREPCRCRGQRLQADDGPART